ncbi:pleckstrin homology domain-containing family A member 3 isoform X6 [Narcine bancroftii]|uniref:pleckstrin homology domain-containing family A member 3 isoform X6 n=1 Tax=Narcine bancroftii TaxID=1343680 RepID=UPI0038312E37
MEGILYKWTNYLTGWQPRWFMLDNGILSYYDSQDDVNKGSKGSIKMAVCEIKVHSTDNTRMELIIPEISETNESLKTKMSELRLYCDLLMQQVHTIQESVKQGQPSLTPSAENMNEASSLLSATCNTFITTLEECMKIANAKFKPEMFQFAHSDLLVSPVSPSPVQMVRVKRSISHPGNILYDRGSLSGRMHDGLVIWQWKLDTNYQKETNVVTSRPHVHRIRTYSDTESYSDGALDDPEKISQISRNSLLTANGEFPPLTIPEENAAIARKKTETESPFVALSS